LKDQAIGEHAQAPIVMSGDCAKQASSDLLYTPNLARHNLNL
jgi:hypothetical protein